MPVLKCVMKFILLTSFLLSASLAVSPTGKSCVCSYLLAPVCGEDGVTYDNACESACYDVEVMHEGACPDVGEMGQMGSEEWSMEGSEVASMEESEECKCPHSLDLVCGSDGQIYDNECLAGCAGVEVVSSRDCAVLNSVDRRRSVASPCTCPLVLEPVCASDGRTYPNKCRVKCRRLKVMSEGRCRTEASSTRRKPRKRCNCPAIKRPVCGNDGKTYTNYCHARCSSVKVVSWKACSSGKPSPGPKRRAASCSCTKQFQPVCGSDGKSYGNDCLAKCNGMSVSHKGFCPIGRWKAMREDREVRRSADFCSCQWNFKPVCGTDGKSYGNECFAKCRGASVSHKGFCPIGKWKKMREDEGVSRRAATCACQMNFSPVCGTDGKSYGNECLAKCGGARVEHKGFCPIGRWKEVRQERGLKKMSPQCQKCDAKILPVCGVNMKHYQNACYATCEGVEPMYKGFCNGRDRALTKATKPDAGLLKKCPKCDKSMKPVCGKNIQHYASECFAICDGTTALYDGYCKEEDLLKRNKKPCACPKSRDRVCGIDGKTYDNECLADCAGARKSRKGPCFVRRDNSFAWKPTPKPCVCTMEYAPVCADGERQYDNLCSAKCADETRIQPGNCLEIDHFDQF